MTDLDKIEELETKLALLEGPGATPDQETLRHWAVLCYRRVLRDNPTIQPGEFAGQFHKHESRPGSLFFGEGLPSERTIIRWIKHLAPPEARRRGRPRKA